MENSTGMGSMLFPSMGGNDKSNFDSTLMKYDSGEPQRRLFGSSGNTGVTGNQVGQPSQPSQPNQTNGTLLGTQGPVGDSIDNWITSSWNEMNPGVALSDQDRGYWRGKVTTPDIFSDNKIRVGPNDYWKARMSPNSHGSADVGLAGDSGVIGYSQPSFGADGMNGMGQQNNQMSQIMPMLMQLLKGQGQKDHSIPQQQSSNGSLFGNAGMNSQGMNNMDISSFLGGNNSGMRKMF